jgi:hypothetical protein
LQIEQGPSDREERARAALGALGIPVIDPSDAFRQARQAGASLYTRTGEHWNVAGHSLVAATLCRWLGKASR